MSKTYIPTAEAAKLAGVTKETIQSLCRNRCLSYRKKGALYMVRKEDVEKYRDDIEAIHVAECDIQSYRTAIENSKHELYEVKQRAHEEIIARRLYPRRVSIMARLLEAVLYQYDTALHEQHISRHEFDMLHMMMETGSLTETGMRFGITKERARQVWEKALHKFHLCRTELDRKDDIIKQLQEHIEDLNRELDGYRIESGKKVIVELSDKDEKIVRFLNTPIKDLYLSARAYNCLAAAEVDTVYELMQYHRRDLLKFRNFGRKSLYELDCLLEDNGLAFGMDVTKYSKYFYLLDNNKNQE